VQAQPLILVLVEPVIVAVKVNDCETMTVVEGVTVTVTTFVFELLPQPARARKAKAPRLGHKDAQVLRNFVNTITPKFSPSACADTRDVSLAPGCRPVLPNLRPANSCGLSPKLSQKIRMSG
jgi:hypothetical protein